MVFSWDRKPLKRKYISVQNKSIRVKYERISPASSGDQDPVAVDAASGSLPKGISTTGSEQVDKQSEEAVFFSDSQTNSSPAVDEVKKKHVSQVRQIFNDCWAKATGNSKVPYKSIKDNLYHVQIKNLPNGVKFRDPSSMGLSTLKEIISARDSLEFSVTRTNKVATSTSLDEPCRLNQDQVEIPNELQGSLEDDGNQTAFLPNLDHNEVPNIMQESLEDEGKQKAFVPIT